MGITKQQLLEFLSQPEALTNSDTTGLESLVQKYPYFQLAYSLIAKSKHDRQTPNAYQALSKASIYAPDRRVLKQLFYDNLHIDYIRTDTHHLSADTIADQDVSTASIESEVPTFSETETTESESLPASSHSEINQEETIADNTASNIQAPEAEIQTSDTSSNSVEEHPSTEENELTPNEIKSIEQEEPVAEVPVAEVPEEPELQNSEEEPEVTNKEDESVYDELQTNLEKLKKSRLKFDDGEPEESEESPEKSSDKKKTVSESSTQESSVLLGDFSQFPDRSLNFGSKQIEQIEIINKFISSDTNHSIVLKNKNPQSTEIQSDLSETSTAIRETPVTENFAVIMEKQGKIDKAVEIYRKLIWKFPQKKTYFADKIKELTEKE